MYTLGGIEVICGPHIITRHEAVRIPPAVRDIEHPALRAAEIEFSRTGADEVVADVLTWEDFFVWTRSDLFIDHRAARLIRRGELAVRVVFVQRCAVDEVLPSISRLQKVIGT